MGLGVLLEMPIFETMDVDLGRGGVEVLITAWQGSVGLRVVLDAHIDDVQTGILPHGGQRFVRDEAVVEAEMVKRAYDDCGAVCCASAVVSCCDEVP